VSTASAGSRLALLVDRDASPRFDFVQEFGFVLVPQDAVQISRSKADSLHRTPAGFTVLALDGSGLCDILPARPTSAASYPISVRRVAILPRFLQTVPRGSALALR
jgi:hypothetical protein